MDSTALDNDTRGWIMAIVSGIACVFGASIICVDVLVRQIPSKRTFRIQDSHDFLAASMSLSFGVLIFSALYSMLPSAKKYLISAGFIPSTAAWILLACFMGGFVGIQIVSRFLHRHLPSHAEPCNHSHEVPPEGHGHGHDGAGSRRPSRSSHGSHGSSRPSQLDGASKSKLSRHSEFTPLLSENGAPKRPSLHVNGKHKSKSQKGRDTRAGHEDHERRSSMIEVPARLMSFVKDTKANCSEEGPCFGYSDPCGQECLKHHGGKPLSTPSDSRHPSIIRTGTGNNSHRHSVLSAPDEEDETSSTLATYSPTTRSNTLDPEPMDEGCESDDSDLESQQKHHHHVHENSYMNIGLQTTIAIALHKLPEGFITYAANHANPSLGFSVFMALFIHNITEGFTMALPLYLALNNRFRAMMLSFLFGGISQPLGAGVAAAWFKIAGREGHKPGEEVYGCMFAITAGIMVFVALQLFVEGLGQNHNRALCIAFAIVGMAIMGLSNALTS